MVTEPAAVVEPTTVPEPKPGAVGGATDPPGRRRRFARLFAFFRGPEPVVAEVVGPEPEEPPLRDAPEPEGPPRLDAPELEPEAAPPPTGIPATEAALAAALDSLGQAHHRPYSRA